MRTPLLSSLAGLLLACPAHHAIAGGYLELFYSSSELEISEDGFAIKEDLDGFGVRGGVDLTPEILLRGEYTSEDADSDGLELDVLRVGIGHQTLIGETTALYLGPDYVRFDSGGDEGATDDGIGVFIGLRHALGPRFAGSVELGYIDVKYEEGGYGEVTLTGLLSDRVGLFGRYRIYALEDKEYSSLEIDFGGFQVGVRFGF